MSIEHAKCCFSHNVDLASSQDDEEKENLYSGLFLMALEIQDLKKELEYMRGLIKNVIGEAGIKPESLI